MTNLVAAYQRNDILDFEKILKVGLLVLDTIGGWKGSSTVDQARQEIALPLRPMVLSMFCIARPHTSKERANHCRKGWYNLAALWRESRYITSLTPLYPNPLLFDTCTCANLKNRPWILLRARVGCAEQSEDYHGRPVHPELH